MCQSEFDRSRSIASRMKGVQLAPKRTSAARTPAGLSCLLRILRFLSRFSISRNLSHKMSSCGPCRSTFADQPKLDALWIIALSACLRVWEGRRPIGVNPLRSSASSCHRLLLAPRKHQFLILVSSTSLSFLHCPLVCAFTKIRSCR
jgi:hypothetical protein